MSRGRPLTPPPPEAPPLAQGGGSGALPTQGALRLARELALIQAFELILEPFLTVPGQELRDLDHVAFTPLRAASFIALDGLAAACPAVGVERLATCLGLDLGTADGLLGVWRNNDWFRAAGASVAQALGAAA